MPGEALTRRSLEVLEGIAAGLTQKEVALRLGVAHSTVRSHMHRATGALGVSNASQAVSVAFRRGLLLGLLDDGELAVLARAVVREAAERKRR